MDKRRTDIALVHVAITVGLAVSIPLMSLVYLCGLAIYYGGRTVWRAEKDSKCRTMFWRACWSVGFAISAAAFLGLSVINQSEANEDPETTFITGLLVFTIVLTPIVFVGFWIGAAILSRIERQRKGIADQKRQLEYERDRQHREKQQRDESRMTKVAQKRRDNARATCVLHYTLHAPDIAKRFPRSKFDAFMQTYMSDSFEPEDVERRGQELRDIIDQHKQQVQPEKRPRTIQELSEWYLREKARIQSLPLDRDVKQDHLVALDRRYSELTQDLLQKMEP